MNMNNTPEPDWRSRIMVLTDLELRIVEINSLGCQLLGVSRETAVQRDFRDVLEKAGLNPVGFTRMVVQIKNKNACSQPITFLSEKSPRPAFEAMLHVLKDESGQALGMVFHASPTIHLPLKSLKETPLARVMGDQEIKHENTILSYLFKSIAQISKLETIPEILTATYQVIANSSFFATPVICLIDPESNIEQVVYNPTNLSANQTDYLHRTAMHRAFFPLKVLNDDYQLSQTYIYTRDNWQTFLSLAENFPNSFRFPFTRDVLIHLMKHKSDRVFGLFMVEYTPRNQKLSMGVLSALEMFLRSITVAVERCSLEDKLKNANTELSQKHHELAKMDQLKAEFVSNITHEVKTPLAIGMGYSELLNSELFGNLSQEQQEALNNVRESMTTLNDVLSSLINFSELNQGILGLQRSDFQLNDLIFQVVVTLEKEIRDKGLHLKTDLPTEVLIVNADMKKIAIVLKILIDNAIKFSEKGTIRVGAVPQDKKVVVYVQDEGIGMSDDLIHYIFESFRQGDGSLTRKYGGLGLGLGMAKNVLDLHKEKIWVKSQENTGSVFSFTLPISIQ